MSAARPGPRNLITDVPGLQVGQAQDETVRTGVTVILPDDRAVCAVDVRGGGPGTRETEALNPENLVDAVDAVVLSGGSMYGLSAGDGWARKAAAIRSPVNPTCRARRSCRPPSCSISATAATRPGARIRPIAGSA
jgi:L-aminopeptidase/D-esterase-like protein